MRSTLSASPLSLHIRLVVIRPHSLVPGWGVGDGVLALEPWAGGPGSNKVVQPTLAGLSPNDCQARRGPGMRRSAKGWPDSGRHNLYFCLMCLRTARRCEMWQWLHCLFEKQRRLVSEEAATRNPIGANASAVDQLDERSGPVLLDTGQRPSQRELRCFPPSSENVGCWGRRCHGTRTTKVSLLLLPASLSISSVNCQSYR